MQCRLGAVDRPPRNEFDFGIPTCDFRIGFGACRLGAAKCIFHNLACSEHSIGLEIRTFKTLDFYRNFVRLWWGFWPYLLGLSLVLLVL